MFLAAENAAFPDVDPFSVFFPFFFRVTRTAARVYTLELS